MSFNFLDYYKEVFRRDNINDFIKKENQGKVDVLHVKGLVGSSGAFCSYLSFIESDRNHLIILNDKEEAIYFFNDLENIASLNQDEGDNLNILFYPASYRKPYNIEEVDNSNVLMRTEVLNKISKSLNRNVVVTFPQALSEKVVSKTFFSENTLEIHLNESLSIDFLMDVLTDYNFERSDFVIEPGQYSIRGGIIDVFSFSNDYPFRIELNGDKVESLRTFDIENQLSISKHNKISVLPNYQNKGFVIEKRIPFLDYLTNNSVVWVDSIELIKSRIDKEYQIAEEIYLTKKESAISHIIPSELFCDATVFEDSLINKKLIEFGNNKYYETTNTVEYNFSPQPSFYKNFELLFKHLIEKSELNYINFIFSDNPKQVEHFQSITEDIKLPSEYNKDKLNIKYSYISIKEGFIDNDNKINCYTDHQIFERYHKFKLKENYSAKQAINLKDLYDLKKGDYVTHIDHGIGIFDGLEKIDVKGKLQEAIRLIYKDNDLLYVSIHSLHRISKYTGKDGIAPSLHRLGSNVWQNLKKKTKQRVKDIAKDLIKLYAERKAARGYKFSPDTYLQYELESSFMYIDTPDQIKSTNDVKRDMERDYPMDRLVCGDVGFGKTEIAIRAAFKAVNDSKQVAVLVPTTILALQHYRTFKERLKDFPCNVDYINRFKSTKEKKETLLKLKEGKTDIIIGTHRLASKDVEFKDLGLLIIDEEQKFGVSIKEKIKMMKTNVATLTLTATPIPRTLQFSLMGARDLSIINTPPPNRYPITTFVRVFKEELIRDAIMYEVSRGGQVYFVNNRIENIQEIAGKIQRLCPDIRIGIGHGRMEGDKLEKLMIDFIEGYYDVLVATTIIESGLDISNANTIIINDAHNFGLSDLHQLRGRVGRTNRKAFCYLLTYPPYLLSEEARKRMKAIEEFSDLGSGINIAMRDLEIRGAGNLLGAEQSGFISEIGFETFHKILDEAIVELKETEFKDLFEEELKNNDFTKECQIETDLEIMIPDYYIESIKERLNIYREIDNLEDEKSIEEYKRNMVDRFGLIPDETKALFEALRLRWQAKKLGIEKIVFRNNKLVSYFVGTSDSAYYQSDTFAKIINFVQSNKYKAILRDNNGKLNMIIENIKGLNQANNMFKVIYSEQEELVG
ncbi:MAG: transcription-repair coupling factor [Bacteroidetes bacterium GWE2_29_8]|nr:MAG: transcription-repair coupling factor [Bacteroidetes bacterium GWE2_29_8]